MVQSGFLGHPDAFLPIVCVSSDENSTCPLQNFMFSSRENMRVHASELYALVVATGETAKRHSEVIRELTANLQSQVGCW